MVDAINPASIFLPMLVVILLTFIAFIRMAAARAAAARGGQNPDYYRAQLGTPEPEATVVAVRHYGNLLELPTLFYTACITGFVLGAVGWWTLVFAWGFVVARLVQSAIHLTYNKPAHRGLSFVAGVFFMIALWVDLTIAIFARL